MGASWQIVLKICLVKRKQIIILHCVECVGGAGEWNLWAAENSENSKRANTGEIRPILQSRKSSEKRGG